MLVLSRRVDETIVLPNLGVTIQLLRINGAQVRVGVQAPRSIEVLRGELVSDSRGSAQKTAGGATHPIREHLAEAAAKLQQLHQTVEQCDWQDAEGLVISLFRELQRIDEVVATLGPSAEVAVRPKNRALLVDDNMNETRLLASYLRLKDFEVETAHNGAEAVHYLARNRIPEVMLLDMQMPRFDGRWTVNEIRANPKYEGMKIFAVSGIHPQEYGVELGGGGVDQWFRKPLNPEQLVGEIIEGTGGALVTAN